MYIYMHADQHHTSIYMYTCIKLSPILIAIVHGVSGYGTQRLAITVEHLRVEHVLQRKAIL